MRVGGKVERSPLKPDNLSSSPRTHIDVEGENGFHEVILRPPHGRGIPTQTIIIYKSVKRKLGVVV